MSTMSPSSCVPPASVTVIVGRGGDFLSPLLEGEIRHVDKITQLASLDGVTRLVLIDPVLSRHAAMNWLAHADRTGVSVWMHAALLPILKTAGRPPRRIGGVPFYCFEGLPVAPLKRMDKTAALLVALAILPGILPLLALLVLRVWLKDGRPVVFAQRRIGYQGHPFTIYKFRTMHPSQTAAKRVTAAGERLRRHGLDELPQFFNLLQGKMALIGPRPLPVAEHPQAAGVGAWMSTRERVLPGLTGLYQVCPHRRTLGLYEMCILDAFWIHNRSLRLNAWILMRTVVTMLRG